MQTLIEKSKVLIEALPYIQRFRGAVVVIKFGGSTMDNRSAYEDVLADVTFMECVGMKPVIVHGGGRAISDRMKAEGIQPVFVHGLRVTDQATVRLVETVLRDEINSDIVKTLVRYGARAEGLHGVVRASRHPERDLGFVGVVESVDTAPLLDCLRRDTIPVITPMGLGPGGEPYNVNADDVAAAVATALKARKLVYLSDIPGLLSDPSDPSSVIPTLKMGEAPTIVKRLEGGMTPKIKSAIGAMSSGVNKVHIIDGRLPHSLLLEIFTDRGVGTEIVHDD